MWRPKIRKIIVPLQIGKISIFMNHRLWRFRGLSHGWRSALAFVGVALLFFVVSALYFAPQFAGEELPQHDVVQYEGMAHDIRQCRAQTGEDPQWTGGMFGGMPA